MFANLIVIIFAIIALFGAGVASYTYFEYNPGPLSPVANESLVATSTAQIIPTKIAPLATSTIAETVKVPAKQAAPKPAPIKTPSEVIPAVVIQIPKEVIEPGPLRATTTAIVVIEPSLQTTLSIRGIIEWTNVARLQNGGFMPLASNESLNVVAKMKLDDMFAKQYFEHVSPTGVGLGDLVKTAGYEFIIVGENLALGNFEGDKGLVDAWMNSPGHRLNILKAHYQEIGVAAGKGTYEGRETWLAVQSFGMPTSACPAIDMNMKVQIDANNAEIARLQAELDVKKAQIDATPIADPNYNIYVNEFNAIIPSYNTLVESNRALVTTYNAQVQASNDCGKVTRT